jgi:hypothetical protein
MNDSLAMRFIESVRDLRRVSQKLSGRQRTFFDASCERLALEILHHQVFDSVLMAHVIKRTDVRMIQARNGARFALESLANFRRVRDPLRKNFYGNGAVEPRVARAIDFAHSARADCGPNLVRAQRGSGG